MALTVHTFPRATVASVKAERVAIRMAPPRDGMVLAVGLIAAVLSMASTYYYFRHHLILGYQDSFSHLEVSRRVAAGLSPGIAQLGGIWLPVPQLLQGLLSWNDVLYRTGLAGSAVSMACFVASTVLLYRLIRVYSGGVHISERCAISGCSGHAVRPRLGMLAGS